MNELGSKYEVEEGHGVERDEVLAKHNVETFLIIPPSTGPPGITPKRVINSQNILPAMPCDLPSNS